MADRLGSQRGAFVALGAAIGLVLAGLVIPRGLGSGADGQASPSPAQATVGSRTTAPEQPPTRGAGGSSQAPGGAAVDADPDPGRSTPRAGTVEGSGPAATGQPPSEPAEAARPAGGEHAAETGDTPGATDRGVTAEAIRLGIMIFDIGGFSDLGVAVPGADPEEQRQWWQAWIDELNQRGGIHGRQVEPSYHRYDVLDQDSQRAACLEATETAEVFAAVDIAGIGPGTVLCFTREHRTPFLAKGITGFTTRDYQRSQELLFSLFAEGQRTLANFVWELDQLGELEEEDALGQPQNKTIGLLSSEGPGAHETIERGLVATLEDLGYEVAHWSELSSDMSTASGQIPVAVNQMRRQGVNAVLLLTGLFDATQFVQEAESQRYFPAYYMSDWLGGAEQETVQSMPDSFDGTLITTSRTGEQEAGSPQPPFAQECLEIYEQQTGEQAERVKTVLSTCQLFRLFELGARAAGPELTRTGLSRGLQSLGEIPLATFGGGTLAPGKFGAADLVRTGEFSPDCSCWLPVDDFRDPRF